MNSAELKSVLDKVTPGTKLRIVFPKGDGKMQTIPADVAQGPLTSFSQMFLRRMFKADMTASLVLPSVISSKQWEQDQNRSFTVETTEHFNAGRFQTHLGDYVESVTIV